MRWIQAKRLVRRSFDHVNNHRWDELLKSATPNVHHRFGGAHAIGGERHDKETLRRWFERLGRVLPNLHLKINNIWVKGWPWHTTVFVQWDATATLLNGDASRASLSVMTSIAPRVINSLTWTPSTCSPWRRPISGETSAPKSPPCTT
jgi:ketosteroid isomerase-like protein